jgi:hypothetical protein
MTEEFNQGSNIVQPGNADQNISQAPDLTNYLPKDEVSKIVADQKKSAYEKGYQKALSEAQSRQSQNETQLQSNSNNDYSGFNQDEVKRMIENELKRNQEAQYEAYKQQQQQQEAQRILNELSTKVQDASQRYDDFHDVVGKVDYINNLPDILELSNLVDNSGDVLYELAKSPMKIAGIRGLPPNLAALEIQRLSQSIKSNQISAKKELPKDPLSKLHASNVGTNTGERKGVQYWKNDPRLRA